MPEAQMFTGKSTITLQNVGGGWGTRPINLSKVIELFDVKFSHAQSLSARIE